MAPIEIAVQPGASLLALGFVASGVVLGTASGLTPGLHANNFAMLMAAVAPAIPGPPRLVGAAMLAAGVVHTFLDVVPSLALGVPDASMAAAALPGHRLVLAGRGREALRLSALGSGLAVAFAVPLALPVTWAMGAIYPLLRTNLSVALTLVAVALVLTEPTGERRVGSLVALAASGFLGWLTLDLTLGGFLGAGSVLTPLFAGLFGAPILIEALGSRGIPHQEDALVGRSPTSVGGIAFVGTLCGAVVGYVPGVSSAIAATGALVVLPSRGPRPFLVASSGVNTANTVFALFALVALGSPRTGVLVAMDTAGVPIALPLLLASVVIAAAAGFWLVLAVGDRYLAAVGRADQRVVSLSILAVLGVLSLGFAGPIGLLLYGCATVVGLVPGRFRSRRANLMGVLLVPLAI